MQFWSSFNVVSKTFSPFACSFVKISLLKSSKFALDPQFSMFLKQVPHFSIFELHGAEEILACILGELYGDFILAKGLLQVSTRVTIDSLFCNQSIENEDSFTIFKLPCSPL